MRYLQLPLVSASTFAVALALSGCGSTVMNSKVGPAPAVENVGVQANGVAPNRALYVQFNVAMDPSTINNQTVMVTDAGGTAAAGTVTYNSQFDVAAFQPSPALQENASYTLKVTTGVASAEGSHPISTFTQNFTTRAQTDTSPIAVKNVTPFPDQSCVSTSTTISITFTEGADISTLNSSNIMISGPGGVPISAGMSYNVATATVTLTPNAPLPSGSITVWVSNVADAAGQKMTSPFEWSFLTTCSSGGGGTSSGNLQYQAPILDEQTLSIVKGKVTVDTMGNVTVQLNGGGANQTYTVEFCPAIDPLSPNAMTPCVAIFDKFTTDGNGNASQTGLFPESGNWAGEFYLSNNNQQNTNTVYQTWLNPKTNNEVYQAKLLPKTTTNGGADTDWTKQDPLTSGSVNYTNGKVTFVVVGASPNTQYETNESETNEVDSSGTYEVSTFTTDSFGNGSSTTVLSDTGGDMLQVIQPQGTYAGYIGGFSVP